VRTAGPAIGIVAGGAGVPEHVAAASDVVVCRHVADAVAHVDGLVKRARGN